MKALVIAALLIYADSAHAGFWGKFYRVSQAILVAGNAADAHSSWNRRELNPILAGPNGRFGARGVSIKAAIAAGWIITQELTTRKDHRPRKAFAIANTAGGVFLGGVAVRNNRRKR